VVNVFNQNQSSRRKLINTKQIFRFKLKTKRHNNITRSKTAKIAAKMDFRLQYGELEKSLILLT